MTRFGTHIEIHANQRGRSAALTTASAVYRMTQYTKTTPTPRTKLASRPSRRLLTPMPSATSMKARHAAGIEYFFCHDMIWLCGKIFFDCRSAISC